MDIINITNYFRSNLFEAIASYNAWKMISHSKSKNVVSEEMAERYVEIQKYHSDFFVLAERSFLVNFVLMSLHSFDKRKDSSSLYKVNRQKTEKFVKDNKIVIENLQDVRNEIFAHKNINSNPLDYKIPAVLELDKFFQNLIKFYNDLTKEINDSSTMFGNAEDIKRSIELLFMNLYRGEAVRRKEIDIDWMWDKNDKKASDVL
jgi:hypothetical protein